MIKYTISNIVANTTINEELDLHHINTLLENVEYNPEIYFALIYRLNYPKLSILINKSGKIIFTGAKSMTDIEVAREILYSDLKLMDYVPQYNEIIPTNIVIVSNLDKNINLEKICASYTDENIKYEPEEFPGLVFKNTNPQFTALIFHTGKISVVGLKKLDDIEKALNITKMLTEC